MPFLRRSGPSPIRVPPPVPYCPWDDYKLENDSDDEEIYYDPPFLKKQTSPSSSHSRSPDSTRPYLRFVPGTNGRNGDTVQIHFSLYQSAPKWSPPPPVYRRQTLCSRCEDVISRKSETSASTSSTEAQTRRRSESVPTKKKEGKKSPGAFRKFVRGMRKVNGCFSIAWFMVWRTVISSSLCRLC